MVQYLCAATTVGDSKDAKAQEEANNTKLEDYLSDNEVNIGLLDTLGLVSDHLDYYCTSCRAVLSMQLFCRKLKY